MKGNSIMVRVRRDIYEEMKAQMNALGFKGSASDYIWRLLRKHDWETSRRAITRELRNLVAPRPNELVMIATDTHWDKIVVSNPTLPPSMVEKLKSVVCAALIYTYLRYKLEFKEYDFILQNTELLLYEPKTKTFINSYPMRPDIIFGRNGTAEGFFEVKCWNRPVDYSMELRHNFAIAKRHGLKGLILSTSGCSKTLMELGIGYNIEKFEDLDALKNWMNGTLNLINLYRCEKAPPL